MNPERLSRWLSRNRVGAEMLQLRADDEEGPFQRWQVEALPDDLVQAIFDCCGDYADGKEESVRVAIEYVNEEGDVISKTIHKATTKEAQSWDAENAANVSEKTIISQLLRHVEVQQRVLSGSSMGSFQAMERVIAMQSKLIEKQAQQIASLSDQILAMRVERIAAEVVDDEASETTEEESRARARALEKVSEYLPTVANTALAYVQQRMSNGHNPGGPVHAEGSVT